MKKLKVLLVAVATGVCASLGLKGVVQTSKTQPELSNDFKFDEVKYKVGTRCQKPVRGTQEIG